MRRFNPTTRPRMNLSVAQPSTVGLRGAYSEGNLYQGDMFGGGLEEPRQYGSVPWLNDNANTRYNAATNKYIHMTSSIFDDPMTREKIRHERGRAALEELKQQVAEKEEAKKREKEEEERVLAAMNAPSTYNPSFQESNPRRRHQGDAGNGNIDQAATVEDTGGGYYGDLGGSAYDTGGYDFSSNYDPGPVQEYQVPRFYGGRRPQRYNANMTSEEREMVNRGAKSQFEGELEWQLAMKRQLDAERQKKEELEERLMEESIKKQQERMKQEYEAELDKKRRREEEQNRRRDAQLRHIEKIQEQMRQEKESKVARAKLAADLASATPPRDVIKDTREIKPAQKTPEIREEPAEETPQEPRKTTSKPPSRRRVPKKDEDFGLNLKSDSRFLAAQQPNKFFDSPTTPVKMARTAEDRKRPKPMPDMPYTVSRHTAGGLHGPPKHRSNREKWESERKHEEPRPAVVKGTPFDWRVKIDGLSYQEKQKVQRQTEDEIKEFKERNGDVMSQLNALKSGLKPNHSAWNPGGTGRQTTNSRRTPKNDTPKSNYNSGYEPSFGNKSPSSYNSSFGSKTPSGYDPSFGGQTPSRNRSGGRNSGGQYQPQLENSQTIPAGRPEGVDYMRIKTPDGSVSSLPSTASGDKPSTDYPFNPDDTDGTMIRKFLTRTED